VIPFADLQIGMTALYLGFTIATGKRALLRNDSRLDCGSFLTRITASISSLNQSLTADFTCLHEAAVLHF
jgi:hypothetical protein